jgi:hypothetical protein
MMASEAWSIVEGPLMSFVVGLVLMIAGILLLAEYRRLFTTDPRSVMSIEVLMAIVNRCGAPGYLAAFLIAGGILSLGAALVTLAFNAFSYFTGTVY